MINFVNLIKAGAFDSLENKPRGEILTDFIHMIADQKKHLTLSNFLMLIRKNLVPKELDEEKKKNVIILLSIFVSPASKIITFSMKLLWSTFLSVFPADKVQQMIGPDGSLVNVIGESWWDNVYELMMNKVRSWLKLNEKELLAT